MTNATYNPTRVTREFRNGLTFAGASLVYFASKGKHVVILREGCNDDCINRTETIEDARLIWAEYRANLAANGYEAA
jgi:hypothetical protein